MVRIGNVRLIRYGRGKWSMGNLLAGLVIRSDFWLSDTQRVHTCATRIRDYVRVAPLTAESPRIVAERAQRK